MQLNTNTPFSKTPRFLPVSRYLTTVILKYVSSSLVLFLTVFGSKINLGPLIYEGQDTSTSLQIAGLEWV